MYIVIIEVNSINYNFVEKVIQLFILMRRMKWARSKSLYYLAKKNTERQIIIRVNTPFSIEHDLNAYEYYKVHNHYMIKSTKRSSAISKFVSN